MEINLTESQQEYILKLASTTHYRDPDEVFQEILQLHRIYIEKGLRHIHTLDKGIVASENQYTKIKQPQQGLFWSKICPFEIKSAYFMILIHYGYIQTKDLLECVLLQNTYHTIWRRQVDYLYQSQSQNISFTFIWFANKIVQTPAKTPYSIVGEVLEYFREGID